MCVCFVVYVKLTSHIHNARENIIAGLKCLNDVLLLIPALKMFRYTLNI